MIKTLIVSDYPVVRAGVRAMLKAADIRVVGETGAAEEVLRLVKVQAPDLIVADVRAGSEDDLDLLRRIKEKWPRLGVIALTADESTVHLSRVLALGCSGYLPKSIGRKDLLKAIRAIARGETVVEPTLLRELLQEVSQRQPNGTAAPPKRLTVPEREVLCLIADGRTNRQIAQQLGYSLGTVKDYLQKTLRKLEVADRTQAAVKALRLGLFD